jgi:hypothetical protein
LERRERAIPQLHLLTFPRVLRLCGVG